MPTNTALNSGPIDVSRWAGQTVEFFFGLLGGTSINANLTLSGMRFYEVQAPALSIEIVGNEILVSWPVSVQGYALQSTPTLSATNQWGAVTNTPALLGLRNVVTNSISNESIFYRLAK